VAITPTLRLSKGGYFPTIFNFGSTTNPLPQPLMYVGLSGWEREHAQTITAPTNITPPTPKSIPVRAIPIMRGNRLMPQDASVIEFQTRPGQRLAGTSMANKIRAYLLIEASAGAGNGVLEAVRNMPSTVEADRVTGPYDVIAVTETDTLNQLSTVLHDDIQPIRGITRTMSCLRFEA
jgi:DNA-binding Lrp family transcriptional regulator